MKCIFRNRIVFLLGLLSQIPTAYGVISFSIIINNTPRTFIIAHSNVIIRAHSIIDISNAPYAISPQQPLMLVPTDDPNMHVIIQDDHNHGLQTLHPELASFSMYKRKITNLKNGSQQAITYPGQTLLCKNGENILELFEQNMRKETHQNLRLQVSVIPATIYQQSPISQTQRSPLHGRFPIAGCTSTRTPTFVPGFTQTGTLCAEYYISPNFLVDQDILRYYLIYLPYGYAQQPEKRYPVLFYLHGTPSAPEVEAPFVSVELDLMIAAGLIEPMIVVFPNGNVDVATFLGVPYSELPEQYQAIFNINGQLPSYWTDSSVLGNSETDLVFTLYNLIDLTYRTKKGKQFKAINGFSGGGAAQYVVLPHSDRFGAVSTNSGYGIAWNKEVLIYPIIDQVLGALAEQEGFVDHTMAALRDNDPLNVNNPVSAYLAPIQNQALALSPNPSALYQADFPTDVNGQLIPSVVAEWTSHAAPERAMIFHHDILRNNLRIYHDAGAYDFFFSHQTFFPNNIQLFDVMALGGSYYNATNSYYSQVLTQLHIPHDYVSYIGNHNEFASAQMITAFMFHSAVFSENDTGRAKIMGVGEIILQDNAVLQIFDNVALGIETDPRITTTTDIQLRLHDYGRIQIGNNALPGGSLQIGSPFSDVDFQRDPSLADHTVSCTIILDGSGAELQINRHGILGLGAGVLGHQNALVNFSVLKTLTCVHHIGIQLDQGVLRHSQIAAGSNPQASLMAVGQSDEFLFTFNPPFTQILGGGNLVNVQNADLLQPTFPTAYLALTRSSNPSSVTYIQGTFAGPVSQGIRGMQEYVATNTFLFGFIDELVSIDGVAQEGITVLTPIPFHINASYAHTNSLITALFVSQPMLQFEDKGAPPINVDANTFFNYIKMDDYDSQINKMGALSLNNSRVARLAYLYNRGTPPGQDMIVRLRQDQFPDEIPYSSLSNTNDESSNTQIINRSLPFGAVGMLLNAATPPVLAALFDLEDAGEFQDSDFAE